MTIHDHNFRLSYDGYDGNGMKILRRRADITWHTGGAHAGMRPLNRYQPATEPHTPVTQPATLATN